jgi:hypothetical protein
MPSWKKVITSGSDASLASLFVTSAVTSSIFSGSRYIGTSFTGSFSGSVAAPGSNTNIIYNSSGVLAGSTNFIFDGTNVGIGTTSPSSHLDIRGTADTVGQISLQLRSGNTSANFNSNQITFGYANTALYRHAIKTRHNDGSAPGNAIDFYTWRAGVDTTSTIGTQHVMSLNGANVGIGTTTPQTGIRLDVSGAAAIAGGTEGIRLGNIGDNSNYDNVKIYYTGFNASAPRVYLTPRTTPGSGIINTYFHLLNSNGSSTTSNNTIGLLVDGSVGIGTTSPGYKLHISGGSEYIEGGFGTNTATAYTSTNRLIFNNDYSDTARGPNKITLYDSVWLGGFGVHTDTLGYYSGANHRWYQASSATNAVHLMTLSTAGNLGIGTTNPGAKLSVVGSTDIIGATTISGSFSNTGTFSLQRITPVGSDFRQIVITSGGANAANVSVANNIICIGPNSGAALTGSGADSIIAIGNNAAGSITTGGSYSVIIGRNAGRGITTGFRNVIIGAGDQTNIPSSTSYAIHIVAGGGYEGNDAARVLGGETSQYAFIGGGGTHPEYTRRFYFGGGAFVTNPANANIDFYAPSATGSTDQQGANFTLNAGRGTGAGTPGDFIIATSTTGSSGTTNQTLSNRVWIKGNSGNVGIGSSTPTAKLDVNGNIRATSFTGSFSGSVAAAGSNTQIIYNNAGVLAGSNNFIFNGSSVGIGTTTPDRKLSVSGSIGAYVGNNEGAVSITVGEGTTGPTGNIISLETNSTSNTTRIYNTGTSTSLNIGSTGTTSDVSLSSVRDLYFKVNNGGDVFAGTTALYVSSSTNIGIGTTNPIYKLHSSGIINSDGGYVNSQATFTKSYSLGNIAANTTYTLGQLDFGTVYTHHFRVRVSSYAGTKTFDFIGYQAGLSKTVSGVPYQQDRFNTLDVVLEKVVDGSNQITGVKIGIKNGYSGEDFIYSATIECLSVFSNWTALASNTTLTTFTPGVSNYVIAEAGSVGIGTTSPGTTLDIIGNVRATSFTGSFSGSVAAAGSNTQIIYNNSGVLAGSSNLVFNGSNVGIGSVSPAYPLDVNGTVRVTTLIETSTKILKENIQPYSTDINKFKKLKPVSFNWKDTKKEDIGLIAEDLNKVFPEFVSKDDGKPVGIHYGKLAAIFINVIKEQQERIETLEKQVKKLIK